MLYLEPEQLYTCKHIAMCSMRWFVNSCVFLTIVHVTKAKYGIVPARLYPQSRIISARDMDEKPDESNKIFIYKDIRSWFGCLAVCPKHFDCEAVVYNMVSMVCGMYTSSEGAMPLPEGEQAAAVVGSSSAAIGCK